MTNTAVAQAERLHDSTVKDLDRIYMQQQVARAGLPAPRAIGVDEIAIRKGHDYRIVVSDLDRRRPIWVGGKEPHRSRHGPLLCHAGRKKDGAHSACRDGQVEALSRLAQAPCTTGTRDLR